MRVTLTVLAGPNVGHVIPFDGHDAFVAGRSRRSSTQLPHKDPYFSRYHFLVEINPPLCRVLDLESHNGTFVNGEKVARADLLDGDRLKAGHTVFRVDVEPDDDPPPADVTVDPEATAQRSPPLELWGAVPGFRNVREIGRGGMGVVYEAVREADDRTVALKTFHPAVEPTRAVVERFLREAKILRDLDHPNIVRLIDSGEDGGRLWFAMEHVPGVDGSRWVKDNGPMPVADAVRLTATLVSALRYAHALGYVHRDVKPSNVLLGRAADGGPVVKLADFGLARAYDDSRMSGLTLTGEVGGTPAFMPPEQILDFRNVGPPADEYSTAATLYYFLTGKLIFNLPGQAVAAYGMVLKADPVPIRDHRGDIPEWLAEAIHLALDKRPEYRWAGVEQLMRGAGGFCTGMG